MVRKNYVTVTLRIMVDDHQELVSDRDYASNCLGLIRCL